jgi:tetratricopeptide (TPR) repeat protein
MKRIRPLCLVLLAVFCALALWKWSFRPQRCESEFARLYVATQSVGQLRRDSEKILRAESNLEQLRQLARQCPADVRIDQFIGTNETLAGRPLGAIAAYEHSLTIDPRTEIYVAMGHVLLSLGRIDEATEAYTTAALMRLSSADEIPAEEIRRRVDGNVASRLSRAR